MLPRRYMCSPSVCLSFYWGDEEMNENTFLLTKMPPGGQTRCKKGRNIKSVPGVTRSSSRHGSVCESII